MVWNFSKTQGWTYSAIELTLTQTEPTSIVVTATGAVLDVPIVGEDLIKTKPKATRRKRKQLNEA